MKTILTHVVWALIAVLAYGVGGKQVYEMFINDPFVCPTPRPAGSARPVAPSGIA